MNKTIFILIFSTICFNFLKLYTINYCRARIKSKYFSIEQIINCNKIINNFNNNFLINKKPNSSIETIFYLENLLTLEKSLIKNYLQLKNIKEISQKLILIFIFNKIIKKTNI